MINEYDEIKALLKRSRMLMEQPEPTNLARSIENEINADRISGGLFTMHGKDKKDLELTTEEKTAFQETMDEFVNEVSDLSDFGVLNLYPNEVQWSGKVIDLDIEFFSSIGENNGVYINGDMIKLDETLTELITKLTTFYDKFKAKWAKVISQRKKTQIKTEE